ncbi:HIT family protein [Virgibacillus dokdonensis]|uniref:HIT-like protein n=1 Tax=Virgibacillus dokdonensis TaxID=302167 RepID=A0A2K9J1E7_9BACI|nr:HIT domain-containing protein [Virgibacillus dokdonensis]AUJ23831.1 HIT-like protein [Virgibacillus dokdonensis]
METCIFCQITREEAFSYTIYKNEYVTAFLDKYPVNSGHILLVTNQHYKTLDLINNKTISIEIINTLIYIAKKLVNSGFCNDYSILQGNGINANQEIMHVHFHIIPRFKSDNVKFLLETDYEAAAEKNMEKTFKKILEVMKT